MNELATHNNHVFFSLYLVLCFKILQEISTDGEYFIKEEKKLCASGECQYDHSE